MSMIGLLTYFLGLQVQQSEQEMFVSQVKYAKDLVKKFGLDSKSHVRTSMSTSVKLTSNLSGKSVDQTLYRRTIGSLLYLITCRPDISFSVGVYAQFQGNLKESHLTAVKRIIQYVNSIVNHSSWCSRDTILNLADYTDVHWEGSVNERKSTSSECFDVGTNLVAWMNKQNVISIFIVEAKYIAAKSCCTKLLWMKKLLTNYGLGEDTMVVYCDNQSIINISKNHVQHSRN